MTADDAAHNLDINGLCGRRPAGMLSVLGVYRSLPPKPSRSPRLPGILERCWLKRPSVRLMPPEVEPREQNTLGGRARASGPASKHASWWAVVFRNRENAP